MAIVYVPYDGPVVTLPEAKALGLKWYFNGKPCKRGHISQRRTTTRACQGCLADTLSQARDHTKATKLAAPTPRQVASAAGKTRYWSEKPCPAGHVGWRGTISRACCACATEKARARDKERANALAARWREANREAVRAACRRHNEANRQKRREQARAAYAVDPDKGRARTKAWRQQNPESVRAHAMTRWAIKKGSAGTYTAQDVHEMVAAQKGKCINCLKPFGEKFHVDHIVPLSRGGPNIRSNLQILCPFCNISKHAADPIEWAQRNGRLL